MKILAALKKIKHFDRKIDKHVNRIIKWSSYVVDNKDDPEPIYNSEDILKMQQQIKDWAAEKVRIRLALHLTNVRTRADWNGRSYSIDELLLIQNVLIPAELRALTALKRKDKGDRFMQSSSKDSHVVLQYNPKNRDLEVERIEYVKEQLDEILDNLNIETNVVGFE